MRLFVKRTRAIFLIGASLLGSLSAHAGTTRYCVATNLNRLGAADSTDPFRTNSCPKGCTHAGTDFNKCKGDLCDCSQEPSRPTYSSINMGPTPADPVHAAASKPPVTGQNSGQNGGTSGGTSGHASGGSPAATHGAETVAAASRPASPPAKTTPAPSNGSVAFGPMDPSSPDPLLSADDKTTPLRGSTPEKQGATATPPSSDYQLTSPVSNFAGRKSAKYGGASVSNGDSYSLGGSNSGAGTPGSTTEEPATGPQAAGPARTGGGGGPGSQEPEPMRQSRVTDSGRPAATERYERGEVANHNDDDCAYSSGVDAQYGCRGTNGIIQGAKAVNAVSQAGGSIATAAIGQSAQMKAMSEGTQSSALRAAAQTQKTSGIIQLGAGGVNVLAGAVQLQRVMHHNRAASELGAAAKFNAGGDAGTTGDGRGAGTQGYIKAEDGSVAQKIIDGGAGGHNMNEAYLLREASQDPSVLGERQRQFKEKQAAIKSDVKFVASRAKGEQKAMADTAMQAGMMSLITGASQIAAGGFAVAGAKQLEKAAKNMEKAEDLFTPTPGFTPLGAVSLAPTDPVGAGSQNSLNPASETPNANGASTDNAPADLGTLGDPVGSPQNVVPNAGPTPGAFIPPSGGGGNPGGGTGSGMGGVSTAASAPDQGDPQAKQADAGKGAGYDGGSGVFGGGGGGGLGADRGPDLSSLLAQFLPKKEDEKNGKDILDFGGRNPAAEGPISLLDRNANIFERVHETYQDKNRKGRVGL